MVGNENKFKTFMLRRCIMYIQSNDKIISQEVSVNTANVLGVPITLGNAKLFN
jgi:hypothetical protein